MTGVSTKAIVFDLYGVLALNGWQAFKVKHFADREDVWHELYEIGRMVDAGLTDYEEMVDFAAKQTGESVVAVRRQLERNAANDQLLQYIQTHLKPHYKIGILSNASSDVTSYIFTPGQLQLFDAIVLSHGVGLIKPQPEIYEVIAARLDVEASECIFVDDHERHITGANEAGMRTILYTDFKQFSVEIEAMI